MPLSTLKEKGQITLPSSIRRQIHAEKGDLFDFQVRENKVIMTRKKIVLAKASVHKKTNKLSKYIGAGKGVFGSPKEIDNLIRKQRKEWD